jgi:hypothetical protein
VSARAGAGLLNMIVSDISPQSFVA